MIPLSEGQLTAYASAVYEIEVNGSWRDASAFVLDADGPPATLISACNPWSQVLSETENANRHHRLLQQIVASGCPWANARGRSADNSWIEPGFLVHTPADLVDIWARAWQQHAVLVLRGPGRAPTLRLYSPFAGALPPQRLANLCLEWVGCGPPASP